jgi:XTP/dITP diphosphohydrolase
VWDQVGQLHLHHGEVPPEMRVLKLTEEVGEAAEALIGLHGWNSRKGKCRTRDDVLDELADVIITAAVAMAGIAPAAADAEEHFQRRLSTVVARAGLSSNASAPPAAAPADNTVTFVTSNPAKAATAREHLAAFGVTVEHLAMELDEIQSVPVEDIAVHKARQAYTALRRPVITEDGGFGFDELGGFPGSLAKAALSMLGLDGMIKLADMTATRSARFRSAVAYVDHDSEHAFSSQGPVGQVASHPATATRQGAWSPLWNIWIPPGASVPVSAMGDREYAEYLAAWRSRSVFTQLGEWLRARREQAG